MKTYRLVGVAAALLLAVGSLFSAVSWRTASAQEDVSLREILDNSDQYIGQDVTVTGTAGDFITTRSFTMTGQESNESLLVVASPDSIPGNLFVGEMVEVSGTVQTFDENLEGVDLWLDPSASYFSEYQGGPVVVADSITVMGQSDDQNQQQGQDGQQDGQGQQVSLSDLVQNADDYVGQNVTVTGEATLTVIPQAFALTTDGTQGEDGDMILVVGDRQDMPENLEGQVQVSGTVEELTTQDIERLIGFDLGFLGRQFGGVPFIMAESVQTVQGDGQQTDQQQTDQQQDDRDVTTERAQFVRLNDIIANTDQYIGDRLATSGEVQFALGRQFILLADTNGDWIGVAGDRQVMPRNPDGTVQVIGTVQELTVEDVEDLLGTDLGTTFDHLEGMPYIVAEEVEAGTQQDQNQQQNQDQNEEDTNSNRNQQTDQDDQQDQDQDQQDSDSNGNQ